MTWWMGLYKGYFPKCHIAWSNSPSVAKLDRGKLCKERRAELASLGMKTTKTYKSEGKTKFSGSKHLRETQSGTKPRRFPAFSYLSYVCRPSFQPVPRVYPPQFGLRLVRLFPDLCASREIWDADQGSMSMSTESLFSTMEWGDLWEEAKAVDVLIYLRGNLHLDLGPWRELFPASL